MRRREHLEFGIIAGIACSILYLTNIRDRKVEVTDLRNIIIIVALSLLGSILPDIIEPPINPNHRSLFHSVLVASLVVKVLLYDRKTEPVDVLKIALKATPIGYLSHLFGDATTPRGLPIV